MVAAPQSSVATRQQDSVPQPSLLNGWKEIANYLGMGVRTVQRYERQLRLPVRRPAGKLRSAVIVSTRELDEWVLTRPTGSPGAGAGNGVPELRRAISELRRLHAERRELLVALNTQRAALELNAQRIREALSMPAFIIAEQHRTLAAEQKARAIEMRDCARTMTDQAVAMRKPSRRRLTLDC